MDWDYMFFARIIVIVALVLLWSAVCMVAKWEQPSGILGSVIIAMLMIRGAFKDGRE